jgi:plasmid rolling circle replication initiator protein Rep
MNTFERLHVCVFIKKHFSFQRFFILELWKNKKIKERELSRDLRFSRLTKPGHWHRDGYATLPQEGQNDLAGAFLSKKNAFADVDRLQYM